MYGSGNYGILGQGNEQDVRWSEPIEVTFFKDYNIRVKDIQLGEYHSTALTEDGDVFTWGYGGKEGYFNWMVSQEVGALGHGDKAHHFKPKRVKYFVDNNIKIAQIGAGLYHNIALSETGEFYTWGRGQYGVLGNGSNQYSLLPQVNDFMIGLRQEDPEGHELVKIKASDEFSGVLTKNGKLFTWGKNDRGQVGSGSGLGVDMVDSDNYPMEIEVLDANEERVEVKDFELGQNTMIILDVDNNVHITGLKLNYTPKLIQFDQSIFPRESVKLIDCGRKHYYVVSKENKMMVWGN